MTVLAPKHTGTIGGLEFTSFRYKTGKTRSDLWLHTDQCWEMVIIWVLLVFFDKFDIRMTFFPRFSHKRPCPSHCFNHRIQPCQKIFGPKVTTVKTNTTQNRRDRLHPGPDDTCDNTVSSYTITEAPLTTNSYCD